MNKKIIKFDDTEIEKYKFYQYKRPISTDNIDANKIVISNKFSFGKNDFKYFIGCKDPKRITPLYIFLPKTRAYRRDFAKTKCMFFFLIKDETMLEKYNEIWKKVSNIIKKEFDNNAAYNEKYTKTKIKFYNGKINTNFYNNKIPKEGSQYISSSVRYS